MKWQLISTAAVLAMAFGSANVMAASEANVSQQGSFNEASVDQTSNYSAKADIDVLGHLNKTYVTQSNNPSAKAKITVLGWGESNIANIYNRNVQAGWANISIRGYNNDIAIMQKNTKNTRANVTETH